MSAFVIASILGTLNATILVGPRIAYAMALDGLFVGGARRGAPRAIGRRIVRSSCRPSSRWRSCSSCGAFRASSTTRRSRSCSRPWPTRRCSTRLRRIRPDLPRPYRAWGYPLVPGALSHRQRRRGARDAVADGRSSARSVSRCCSRAGRSTSGCVRAPQVAEKGPSASLLGRSLVRHSSAMPPRSLPRASHLTLLSNLLGVPRARGGAVASLPLYNFFISADP